MRRRLGGPALPARGAAGMSARARLVAALCAALPKRNTAAVHTWPAFDDTALALVPALAKTRLEKIFYLAADPRPAGAPFAGEPKVEVLSKRSWRAAWVFATSRWIFATHQCYTSRYPHNVESVNVWHGMPIKRIGWMSATPVNAPHAKFELATSAFWKPIVQACMRPWGQVLVNGLPRCDRFAALGRDGVRRRLGGVAVDCARLAVWLPTYRRAVRGDPAQDGQDFGNAAQMPDFDAERFAAWLAARNVVCVLKPHPLGAAPRLRTSGYLRVLDDAALAAQGLTLYALLGGADVLLTDVSSVYVDFLLLDRPVIHTFADRAEYGAGRGFTFDWTEDYFAGPMVADMAGVERALDDLAAGRDEHSAQRQRLRAVFHADPDAPATPSLLRQLGL